MSNLYLTEKREVWQHEEVELLLEGYRLDLEEIRISCRTMLAQVSGVLFEGFVPVDTPKAGPVVLYDTGSRVCILRVLTGKRFLSNRSEYLSQA